MFTGLKAPQRPLAATSFYSALPIMLGRYAVQYAFTARDESAAIGLTSANPLGEGLAARLRAQPVASDLPLRSYTDAKQTPIEDATIEWISPWLQTHSCSTLTYFRSRRKELASSADSSWLRVLRRVSSASNA